MRALLGGRERLWVLPNYGQNCCVRCRWCCPRGADASAAHVLPLRRAPGPRDRESGAEFAAHKVRAPRRLAPASYPSSDSSPDGNR